MSERSQMAIKNKIVLQKYNLPDVVCGASQVDLNGKLQIYAHDAIVDREVIRT